MYVYITFENPCIEMYSIIILLYMEAMGSVDPSTLLPGKLPYELH